MSPLVLALIVVVVVALAIYSPDEEEEPSSADPIDALLAAVDSGQELPTEATHRVMALGTRVVGPLFERLRAIGADPIDPAAQLQLEEIIANFGVAGINALVPDLAQLPRRHAAVPATVRIIEQVGPSILPKLSRERRIPLDLRALVLRRFVARGHPVWQDAAPDDDSAAFVAAEVRQRFDVDELPLDLLRACACLPGERRASVERLLQRAADTELPLDRFDRGERNPHDDLHCLLAPELRESGPARARGWCVTEEPSRRDSLEWFRWAASRAEEVPIREALLEVSLRRADSAVGALCVVGQHNPKLVMSVLRSRRSDGWTVHYGDWLRATLRQGGVDAQRVALERLIRGPISEAALVGSAFADLDICEHLDLLLTGFYRASGRPAVELEALVSAGGSDARRLVTKRFTSEDRDQRRGALQLAGRLGWSVAGGLIDAVIANPLDAPCILPSLELLCDPVVLSEGVRASDVVRVGQLVKLSRAESGTAAGPSG